jgi:hypothetical protein
MHNHFLELPNAKWVQLDFLYDYHTKVELYPQCQAFLKDHQPNTIIFRSQEDIFFMPAGGETFLEAPPDAEIPRLQPG